MNKKNKQTWSLSEPNINSARRKNDNNICAMHGCNNLLSDPPSYGWSGLKICNECRKPIDKMRDEFQLDIMDQICEKIRGIIDE